MAKYILLFMLLITGIMEEMHGQSADTAADLYDVSPASFRRRFFFDLGDYNRMELKCTAANDLDALANIDSILAVVKKDLYVFRDSFANPMFTYRLWYNMDGSDVKKIRVQRTSKPNTSDFVIISGKPAQLKITQDTVIITCRLTRNKVSAFFPMRPQYDYYQVCFYLNDLQQLAAYMDGRLNDKIALLRRDYKFDWRRDNGRILLKADSTISVTNARGYIGEATAFFLRLSTDFQNYKDHFVPATTLSAHLVSKINQVRREFSFATEFHFLFKKENDRLRTYKNIFLNVAYGRARVEPASSFNNRVAVQLQTYLAAAVLVKRSGTYYDPHTMRLGIGQLLLFGTTRIEPAFYFHDVFKNVTPSLRLVQSL